MAKKVSNIQEELDFLKRDYKRIVESFDAVILHNGNLVDGVIEATKRLTELGVRDTIIDQSGLRDLAQRCNYSEILKNAGR